MHKTQPGLWLKIKRMGEHVSGYWVRSVGRDAHVILVSYDFN